VQVERKKEKKVNTDRDPKPKWKLRAPKESKLTKKVVEGKKYNWYSYHNDRKSKWALHTLSKCRNNPNNSDGKGTQHTANAATTNHQIAQQITAGAQATADLNKPSNHM